MAHAHHDHQHSGHHRGHQHASGHTHAPGDFGWAFAVGTALNLLFVVIEAASGFLANSMALLADAGHNLSDVFALLLAWTANSLARRAPTPRYTYGLGSSSILAALANAVILLVAVGLWLVATLFAALLVSVIAGFIAPTTADSTADELIANARTQETLSRVAPPTLFSEATAVILNPASTPAQLHAVEQQLAAVRHA